NFIAKLSSDEPNSDALYAQHQSPKLAPPFANIVQSKSNKRVVKISELRNSDKVDGAAVAIPIEAVEEVSSRFANTLYGYFIGKRLAFPNMCLSSWGRNTYARAMIEVAAEELKESIVIAIPMGNGQGHSSI
nr:hypothetical protein [Tanacetum cinerariifolium]